MLPGVHDVCTVLSSAICPGPERQQLGAAAGDGWLACPGAPPGAPVQAPCKRRAAASLAAGLARARGLTRAGRSVPWSWERSSSSFAFCCLRAHGGGVSASTGPQQGHAGARAGKSQTLSVMAFVARPCASSSTPWRPCFACAQPGAQQRRHKGSARAVGGAAPRHRPSGSGPRSPCPS